MKILLVVGQSDDVFIYNYAKWLKKSMDVELDVFEFSDYKGQHVGTEYYDHVYSANNHQWFDQIRGLRTVLYPFTKSRDLSKFLENRHYDIIHCHWIQSSLVLTKNLKQHTKALVATFWGSEDAQTIAYSNRFFHVHLRLFIKSIDRLINSKICCDNKTKIYPFLEGKCRYADLGSAPLESLYHLMDMEDKSVSKKYFNIPDNKVCVLIGYSGKSLHQHLSIINELKTRGKDLELIHLLVPMTRGASLIYIQEVESALRNCGCSYTLFKDRFFSDEEIARLRLVTDVVLQLSVSDGFSRSIVECLCAKSILLYGSWLKQYESCLAFDGFKGIKVDSISQGVSMLFGLIDKLDEYEEMRLQNSLAGRKVSLWSECIKPWVQAYKELV